MQTQRHLISYILFAVGVIALLLLGLLSQQWGTGVLLALVFGVAGVLFYRRGK